MTTDNSNTPELAVEFHYTDGDVGVYADHLPEGPEYALWTQFEHFDEDRKGTHSHILVRADNAEGQTLSNRLCATEKALRACELLVEAYKTGEANGGSVDWSDVDLAWEVAREALAIAQDTPTDDPEGAPDIAGRMAGPAESCRHEWIYTGTAYGGDDPSYLGVSAGYAVFARRVETARLHDLEQGSRSWYAKRLNASPSSGTSPRMGCAKTFSRSLPAEWPVARAVWMVMRRNFQPSEGKLWRE